MANDRDLAIASIVFGVALCLVCFSAATCFPRPAQAGGPRIVERGDVLNPSSLPSGWLGDRDSFLALEWVFRGRAPYFAERAGEPGSIAILAPGWCAALGDRTYAQWLRGRQAWEAPDAVTGLVRWHFADCTAEPSRCPRVVVGRNPGDCDGRIALEQP